MIAISTVKTRLVWVPRCLGWYLFWLAVILCLYWPGIVILPKNDHPIFMLGRHLAANDWDWFWSVLSYNRTRILLPGDYFAFRPVMIGTFALEDIFFRHQFVVQGIICCGLYSFTATAFFSLFKRLAGILPALSLTFLWIVQLAGSEIVLWQHITPYVLAPGFLCLAAHYINDEPFLKKNALATVACILLACLTHELCVLIACGMAFLTLCLGGVKKTLPRRIITLYLAAAVVALAINALDYFIINPPPSLVGPADSFGPHPISLIFSNLFHLTAAIGIASFLPNSVHVTLLGDFLQRWPFWAESPFALWLGAIATVTLTATAIFKTIRQSIRSGFNYYCYLYLLFVLLLGCSFSILVFRTLSRGIDYMATATYYFSLTSLALCGILGVLTAQLKTKRLVRGVSAALLILAIWHAYALRTQLQLSAPAKRAVAAGINEIRSTLRNNSSLCFAGMDLFTTSVHDRYLTPLFQDVACSVRPTAAPLYVSKNPELALTRLTSPVDREAQPFSAGQHENLESSTILPRVEFADLTYGHPLEFSVKCAAPFTIRLETKTNDSGFFIDHNLIFQTAWMNKQISNYSHFNMLDKYVTFILSYSNNAIQLRANNMLLGLSPPLMYNTLEPLLLSITSSDAARPIYLQGFHKLGIPINDAVSLTRFNAP